MTPLRTAHHALLAKFRHSMNLIGPGTEAQHFEDCDQALSILQSPTGHWVDLGSGAGFPGLVLADLFPQLRVDLVESRKKRCWFLSEVVRQGQCSTVNVLRCRAETVTKTDYDGLVARAFTQPERVMQWAERMVRPGGHVVLFLQDDAHIPDHEAFRCVEENTYVLDGKHRKSALLVRSTD